jgi:hypothetical protein
MRKSDRPYEGPRTSILDPQYADGHAVPVKHEAYIEVGSDRIKIARAETEQGEPVRSSNLVLYPFKACEVAGDGRARKSSGAPVRATAG